MLSDAEAAVAVVGSWRHVPAWE